MTDQIPDPTGRIDAEMAAAFLGTFGFDVTPNLIRVWAHRGKIRKMPRYQGRAMYSLADIWALVRSRERNTGASEQIAG